MKRFSFWLTLHHLMMWIDSGVWWVWCRSHLLLMKVGGYFLDRSRNHIPDEYQDQLIERKEHDPSCEELGCWKAK